MEGSRRSRVKGASLLQDRRSTSSARCSVRCVLAVLRDFSTTDFEGSGLGMQQAKHIPPHTRQGCRRTAHYTIASSRPDSGMPRFPPAAPCALPCWQSGLLRSPEVVRAVEHAGGTPGGSPRWSTSWLVCNNQATCNHACLTRRPRNGYSCIFTGKQRGSALLRHGVRNITFFLLTFPVS